MRQVLAVLTGLQETTANTYFKAHLPGAASLEPPILQMRTKVKVHAEVLVGVVAAVAVPEKQTRALIQLGNRGRRVEIAEVVQEALAVLTIQEFPEQQETRPLLVQALEAEVGAGLVVRARAEVPAVMAALAQE